MLGLLTTRQGSERTKNGDSAEDDLGQVEWGHMLQGEGRALAEQGRLRAEVLPDRGPHA